MGRHWINDGKDKWWDHYQQGDLNRTGHDKQRYEVIHDDNDESDLDDSDKHNNQAVTTAANALGTMWR
jgi:hypothetical protein